MGERNCEKCAYYNVKGQTIRENNDCEVTTTFIVECNAPGIECQFKEGKK